MTSATRCSASRASSTARPTSPATDRPLPRGNSMFTEADYAGAAARLVAPVAHIKAFAQVESSGETEWLINGESVPPLRLEAHWFGNKSGHRFDISHPDLSCVEWNPALAATTRAGALAQVRAAEALDRDAADKATSRGAFQVMGFNYTRLGFANVAA